MAKEPEKNARVRILSRSKHFIFTQILQILADVSNSIQLKSVLICV